MTQGRKPDYNISVLDKTSGGRGVVGAGWIQEDGSISIKINPCVLLDDDPKLVIRMFPCEEKPNRRNGRREEQLPF